MDSAGRERPIRGILASPHPTEGRCLHEGCGGPITDVWAEFMETPAEKAAVSLGKTDFTCPYCDRSLRFDDRTNSLVPPQDAEPARYHYGAAVKRAGYENTSIFGLMRDKGMVRGEKPAFLGYVFKDRDIPLTETEGEAIHTDQETSV